MWLIIFVKNANNIFLLYYHKLLLTYFIKWTQLYPNLNNCINMKFFCCILINPLFIFEFRKTSTLMHAFDLNPDVRYNMFVGCHIYIFYIMLTISYACIITNWNLINLLLLVETIKIEDECDERFPIENKISSISR